MRSIVLAGLRAHLLRLVLTGVVVVLSVGFTAATLILTDSLDEGARRDLAADADGVDLAVLPAADATLTEADLDAVAAVDGVAAIAPRRETTVHTVDADGRIEPFGSARVVAPPLGTELSGDGVRLDTRSAQRLGLDVGDAIAVAATDGSAELVGLPIAALAEPSRDAGDDPEITASWAVVRELADPPGATRVDLRLSDGVDVAAVRSALPGDLEVLTGAELGQRLVDGSTQREALRIPLLMLGAVSLIVAAFVIANTFRILVAQRTRELALLRTVGATRRQVLRSVLAESVAVGLAGSLVGVGAGAVTALVAGAVLDGRPGTMPLVVTGATVGWSVVVGVLMTVGSALLPARAATRVSPLAALQAVPDGADSRSAGRARLVLGVPAMVAGALLQLAGAAAGASGDGIGLVLVVCGAVVCSLGPLILGPKVVPPLVRVLGAVLARLSGGSRSTAELATANAVRNPRRVAATTAALLIGVTTVAGFLTVVESARQSVSVVVDGRVPADFAVRTAVSEPIPDAVAREIEALPEIGSVVVDGTDLLAVNAADGVAPDDARAALLAATDGHPELSVQSFAQRRADFEADLNQAVNIVLGILALALVIAFIGIANTLSLSVHERTREIGLLRALGLTQRQTRVMFGIEAALMGAVAAVVGSAAGALFAWAAVTSIEELEFVVPWVQLAVSGVVATALGVLASVVPGQRAARTSPVMALASE